MGCFAESGTPRFVFNGNGNVNVDGLGLSVDGDSSQTQNDETDDNYKVNGNDDDNGNNKVSTKSVLQLRLYSEVMCIFVLYLVEYRLFRLF